MAEIKRTTLFGKLNRVGYKALESAAVFCKTRGNPEITVAHWLHQLLQLQVGQVIAHHHLQNCEQFAISNEAVLVDIINLEGEAQLVLFIGSVKRGETWMSMIVPERN